MKAKNKQAHSKARKSGGTRRPALGSDPDAHYDLRLYVAGQTPKSLTAFANLKKLCDVHLAGKYRIEVIDLMSKPQRAQEDQIIAIPTLVRRLPQPIKKIIGDLCDTHKTLMGLDLDAERGTAQMIRRRPTQKADAAESFEKANRKPQAHFFRLYVAGSSSRSLRAVKRIKEICEKELAGHYTLEIIDLYQQPARAIADQIVAAPTLVRRMPEPIRLVGDLSDDQKVLALFNHQKTKET